VFVVLIFFCLQLITGLIRRDPTALSRAALGLGQVRARLVRRHHAHRAAAGNRGPALRSGSSRPPGNTTGTMGDKIACSPPAWPAINIAAPGVGAIVTIFLAGLMIAAASIVWFSLLIRKALLLVAVVFWPGRVRRGVLGCHQGWIGKWARS
jgi:hypothetical protein